jgi:multicomponent Na+:H+ antiporter subunit B
MKPNIRLALFLAAGAVFVILFISALAALHPVGQTAGLPAELYGDVINSLSVAERQVTDAVATVNLDVRAFDTLGEEFILFTSVMAVLLLLRRQPDERDGRPTDRRPGRQIAVSSEAVRLMTVGLVGPMVVFGIHIVMHGQVTPGGGFQGGVILASAPLLVYLAGEFETLRGIAPRWLLELGEALGAAGFVLIGAAGVFRSTGFLYNFLPTGRAGDVFSGGTVLVLNIAISLAVAAGFILLLVSFLEETLVRRDPV